MNLAERFDVSAAKVAELRARIARLAIAPAAVKEGFSRGGGKGGQKINKTANRVTLRYAPLGLVVHCQTDRRRTVNRFLALRELVDRVEMLVSPGTSRRLQEMEQARRRKARRTARSRKKHGTPASSQDNTTPCVPQKHKFLGLNLYRIAAVAVIFAAGPATQVASGPTPGGEVGVLVMAHGGDPVWNDAVRAAVQPLDRRVPVEIAFGMADPDTLQQATDALEARGVRRIAVVRLFISGESFLVRTRKILGLAPGAGQRPKDAPATAHAYQGRHAGGAHSSHDPDTMPLWRVQAQSRFALCEEGMMDSELSGLILAERARVLSKDAAAESVLVLAHGAGNDGENHRWMADMDRLAGQVRRAAPFRAVRVETLREDWPEQRREAEFRIRRFVEEGGRGGRVLVIPLRVFGFGPYAGVLKGLDYVSDGKGLIPHPLVSDWLREEAAEAFKKAGWTQAARKLAS